MKGGKINEDGKMLLGCDCVNGKENIWFRIHDKEKNGVGSW